MKVLAWSIDPNGTKNKIILKYSLPTGSEKNGKIVIIHAQVQHWFLCPRMMMPVIVGQISFFPVWQGFVFLFHKELRPSDVSSLGRMILPKASGLFAITCHVLQITASSKCFLTRKS